MTDHRSRIVQRVVHSLEEHRDPDSLVHEWFDAERDVVIEATRATLEATGEDPSTSKLSETVERELVEGLRYPAAPSRGLLPWIYVHRGRSLVAAVLVLGVLAVLLI